MWLKVWNHLEKNIITLYYAYTFKYDDALFESFCMNKNDICTACPI